MPLKWCSAVVVQAWVGKEFPDVRHNEREIKFIRMGDTVWTAGSSRENRHWTGVLSPFLYPGYKEWGWSLAGHLLIGWGMYTGWGKSRANTFSLWGRRGDRLYHSINSYNKGKGRVIRVCFFHSCIPSTPWFYLLFCAWVTTFFPLFIFRANSLAPFDTLLMSNYLHISLLRHLGTQTQRKRGDDCFGFFRLYRGVMGLWVPFACSLSGWWEREMRVHGMIWWLVLALSRCWLGNIFVKLSLGDLLYSRRNKLKKTFRYMAQRLIEIENLLRSYPGEPGLDIGLWH